jgi:hydroxyacylglutathione hydrolase
MHASIDRLLGFNPPAMYLTHFSRVHDIPRLGNDLHRLIDAHCELALSVRGAPSLHGELVSGLWRLLFKERDRQRWRVDDATLKAIFANDIELNAQGLAVWLDGTA